MKLQFGIAPANVFPKPLVICIALALSGAIGNAETLPAKTDPAAAEWAASDAVLWQPQTSKLHQERLRMAMLRVASTVHEPITRVATNCADDGSVGSLRSIVAAALSGDSIDLSALACSTITLTQGQIPINVDDLTIVGPGVNSLTIDGNHQDRVFAHFGYGTLSLSGMTVSNGSKIVSGTDVGAGGCIASGSYLAFTDLVVNHCRAEGEGSYGGAVFAYGLGMSNSTISNSIAIGTHPTNFTAAFGGAAFLYTLDMTNSTISGNSAQRNLKPGNGGYEIGGGIVLVHGGTIAGSTIDTNYSYGRAGAIAAFADSLILSNSTISGNRAQNGIGGGLHLRVFTDLVLYNDTLTANQAALDGGGVFLNPGQQSMTTLSTIISGNTVGAGTSADIYASTPITLGGSNSLIGAITSPVTLPPGTLRTSAHLLPLAANGGSTRTHALTAGSPALDAGTNAQGLANDQRGAGFARVFGPSADIGAFEAQQKLVAPLPAQIPAASVWGLGLLAAMLGFLGWRRRCSGNE
ncbi:hypothetical protein ELE36_02040 [Pseudolysobacter antarcticus]|uniref:IPTL-CTERM sorting domain-containing protein n=1 Tax=Pseudolysobacter antarcticus TaxID=2511995 RepID=A0A411HFI9_9GAMM|nr:choice-of-anchor Q domain-containing protein [Pseudolysobacter antarcticus]QBB69248.1 hypothetical protein ELE36_02040 [Pseudolysobacter antarcticus]